MPDPIYLQLIKAAGREVVCDQEGRPLGNVQNVTSETRHDGCSVLTISVVVKQPKWDESLGLCYIEKKPGSSGEIGSVERASDPEPQVPRASIPHKGY